MLFSNREIRSYSMEVMEHKGTPNGEQQQHPAVLFNTDQQGCCFGEHPIQLRYQALRRHTGQQHTSMFIIG